VAEWFTRLFGEQKPGEVVQVSPRELQLLARVSELEAVNGLLVTQNEQLLERLREFETDNRETQRGLLTRLGVLAPVAQNGEKKPELKPVRKVTPPWHVVAAKAEADSKERYWKKVIEEREKPQEQRKAESEAKTSSEKTEEEQITEDIEELSR
jgi:hypothetical protein